MEAKLIKNKYGDDFYYLMVGIDTYATTHKESFRILSLKNCEEIERGYDLENMADFYGAKAKGSLDFKLGANQGFEDGFKQALEIRSDKKFTEEDMLKSFSIGVFTEKEKGNHTFEYEEYIQSLQQTEWDVEIVMGDPIGIGDKYTPDTKPKLDADGCLILKRIKE